MIFIPKPSILYEGGCMGSAWRWLDAKTDTWFEYRTGPLKVCRLISEDDLSMIVSVVFVIAAVLII
jgi:hypothetical protein